MTGFASTFALAASRGRQLKEGIIQAFCDGIMHKPDPRLATSGADVIAGSEPTLKPGNFCSVIRNSRRPTESRLRIPRGVNRFLPGVVGCFSPGIP